MTYSPAALSGPHPLLQVRQEGEEEEERRGAVGRRGAQRDCSLRPLLATHLSTFPRTPSPGPASSHSPGAANQTAPQTLEMARTWAVLPFLYCWACFTHVSFRVLLFPLLK